MIGGLLFRYWEGGRTVNPAPEHPNVRIEWLRRSRKAEVAPPLTAQHEEPTGELMPLRAALGTATSVAQVGRPAATALQARRQAAAATVRAVGTKARASTSRPRAAAGIAFAGAVATRPTAVVKPTQANAKLAAARKHNEAAAALAVALGQPVQFALPEVSARREYSTDEHNLRAVLAALAALRSRGG